MTLTHDEIPYDKLLYAWDIKERNHGGKISYIYTLHRFCTRTERGIWLREGNMKPCEFKISANKRREKVSYQHPTVEIARHLDNWPIPFVTDNKGRFSLYRKITGIPNPNID